MLRLIQPLFAGRIVQGQVPPEKTKAFTRAAKQLLISDSKLVITMHGDTFVADLPDGKIGQDFEALAKQYGATMTPVDESKADLPANPSGFDAALDRILLFDAPGPFKDDELDGVLEALENSNSPQSASVGPSLQEPAIPTGRHNPFALTTASSVLLSKVATMESKPPYILFIRKPDEDVSVIREAAIQVDEAGEEYMAIDLEPESQTSFDADLAQVIAEIEAREKKPVFQTRVSSLGGDVWAIRTATEDGMDSLGLFALLQGAKTYRLDCPSITPDVMLPVEISDALAAVAKNLGA